MPPRRRARTERAWNDNEPEEDTQREVRLHLAPPGPTSVLPRPPTLTTTAASIHRMRSQNSSLRSFFPLEIVRQIHGHLNLGSLAALGQTSFACLDEVSAALYRDVVVASEKALISFASGVSRHPCIGHICVDRSSSCMRLLWTGQTSDRRSARLDPLLSLTQVRTVKVLIVRSCNDFIGSLLWKGDKPRPRRLAATSTPLALDLLVVAAGSPHPSIGLDTLLLFIFPFLKPVHVDFWSCATLFEARYWHVPAPWPLGGWSNVLRAWSSLRSVTAVGWNPLFSSKGRSVLHSSAWIAGGGPFELELDQRMVPFDPSETPEWVDALAALGVSLTGLKTKLFAGPGNLKLAKERRDKLTDEQRGRFELVEWPRR